MKAILTLLACLWLCQHSSADIYHTYYPTGTPEVICNPKMCLGGTTTLHCAYDLCTQVTGTEGDLYLFTTGTTVNWYINTVDTNWGGTLLSSEAATTSTNGYQVAEYAFTPTTAGHFYLYCVIIPDTLGCGNIVTSNTAHLGVEVDPAVVAHATPYVHTSTWAEYYLTPVAFGNDGMADSFLVVRSPVPLTGLPADGINYNAGDAVGNGIVDQTLKGESYSLWLLNLIPNSNYFFSIFTFNDCVTPRYKTDTFQTVELTTCVKQPTDSISNLTSTAFVLHWNSAVDGGAYPVHYSVQVATDSFFNTITHDLTLDSSVLSAAITGLDPTGTYYYRVVAWSDGSCQEYGLKYDSVINMAAVGVESLGASGGITVYPNPGAGDLTVGFGAPVSGGQITLTDLNGHVLYTNRLAHATKTVIPRGTLPDGVYLLQITTDDHRKILKTVVWY